MEKGERRPLRNKHVRPSPLSLPPDPYPFFSNDLETEFTPLPRVYERVTGEGLCTRSLCTLPSRR